MYTYKYVCMYVCILIYVQYVSINIDVKGVVIGDAKVSLASRPWCQTETNDSSAT